MRITGLYQFLGGIAILASTGIETKALAAPITFNTAMPVSDDGLVLRQQIIYSEASGELNGISRELNTLASVTVTGFGVDDKLALFAVVPVIRRSMKIGNVKTTMSGLADAQIFARYQIYRKDGQGTTTRIAPFLGVNIPTGKTGQTSDGSTDIFGGLILTHASTDWGFGGQIRYVANGRKNGFERGNEKSMDVSLQYRLNESRESVGSGGYLFAVLEANIAHSDRNKLAGNRDPNSGGTTAFLSPGLQYVTRRWVAEAAVRIPVIRDLNGSALRPGIGFVASTRFNF